VLLVDDEPSVLEGLRRILHREPWRVLTACSGQEALALLAQCPVDLVVSDEQMPSLSGSALLAAVSRSHPEVRRVILTGKAMPEDIIRAINEGRVDRYLTKPVASERFLSTIREMLGERERDERMEALSSRAGGICRLDQDLAAGRDQWSPSAKVFFGLAGSAPLERLDDLWPWVAEADLPPLLATFQAARAQGESASVEFRILAPDGIPRWVGAVLDVLSGENGAAIHVLALFQDITGRKRDEAELLLAKSRAEAASRAKSDFLSTVSHELRTPLHIISGVLDLLRPPVAEQDAAQYLGLAEDSAKRLTGIVDGMLEMAGADSRPEAPALFSLAEALQPALESVMDQARAKGLGFALRLDPGLPEYLVGDGRAVGRVLGLAADNAVKFTDQGQVEVRAFFVDRPGGPGSLVLEIEDTGPGMAPGFLDAAFQPFTQEDGSIRRRHGGVGLGLALLRKLVRLHGGSACLDSQPGQGTLLLASLAAATSVRRSPA
jgi:signal transduction histidine kinase/ActR/RegA family two-component response regulator